MRRHLDGSGIVTAGCWLDAGGPPLLRVRRALAQSYVKGDPDVVFVWRSDDGCGSIVEFTKDSDGTVHFKCQWSSRCQNHATGVRHHILLGEVADLRPVPESRDGLDRLVLPG